MSSTDSDGDGDVHRINAFLKQKKCTDLVRMMDLDGDGEMTPMVSLKNVKHVINVALKQKICTDIDRAVKFLQCANDTLGEGRGVVVCDSCAKMIGVKRCSGCSTRYCSRECQVAAWPLHKADCAGAKAHRKGVAACSGAN
jgi:hypothetical protein